MFPVCFPTETETKHLMLFSICLFPVKRFQSCLVLIELCFWLQNLKKKWKLCVLIEVQGYPDIRSWLIFDFIKFWNKKRKGEGKFLSSVEPLFLVTAFDTRVRLTVLGWATYLWCTKWRLILDFFSILICFMLFILFSSGAHALMMIDWMCP